jgi:choice-of-anchor B domain-containing protein
VRSNLFGVRYFGTMTIAMTLSMANTGLAGGFESQGVALLGNVDLSEFPGGQIRGNDIWGYVSPSGREYALVGLWFGTAFVEVTDPTQPVVVGYIPAPGSIWRDIRTHSTFAYIVSQEGDGLQIVDMSGIDDGVLSHTTSLVNDRFLSAHNITVNHQSRYAYLVLGDISRGLAALDLSDPANPTLAGRWEESDLHDAQIVSYDDGPYAGREIAFGFGEENGLQIIDVTDKGNMFTVSTLLYPNTTYCHQGWLGVNRQYVFIGDELDELLDSDVTQTTTYVVDVSDIENPFFVTSFSSGLPAIDHNMMMRGHLLFEANYESGMRVFDVCDVENVSQVAFFDTYPEGNAAGFNGAWGVYTQLPSGVVLLSDRERGLFIFDILVDSACALPNGDADGDDDIDLDDYARFTDCAAQPEPPLTPESALTPECVTFDFDGNGRVDLLDFAAFQAAFTG